MDLFCREGSRRGAKLNLKAAVRLFLPTADLRVTLDRLRGKNPVGGDQISRSFQPKNVERDGR
jgi:hypothetical protein